MTHLYLYLYLLYPASRNFCLKLHYGPGTAKEEESLVETAGDHETQV